MSNSDRWPLTQKNVTRLLVILVVMFALAAGYFQTVLGLEQKKYLRLEDKYVRVRDQLGVDETQRLIDQSYEPVDQ